MSTNKVFYATCDEFDDCRTGYHASEEAAIAAFWAENVFSTREKQKIQVYCIAATKDDNTMHEAIETWFSSGSMSPGLEPEFSAELEKTHEAMSEE